MPLANPIDAWLQVAQIKERNRQQAMQDAQGIGQNFGDLGKQMKQKQLLDQLKRGLAQPQTLPVQGPQLPGMSQAPIPPRPGQPGTSLPNPQADLMPILAQLYPQEFGKSLLTQADPLKQSEIFRNYATGQKAMGGGPGTTGKTTVWEDPKSGRVSSTKQEGWLPRSVSDASALQYTGVPKSTEFKAEGQKGKEIEKQWNEVKKITNPFRSSGIGGASSVYNKAAAANQAAARGLKIAKKKDLTFKELNAYVNSDIASLQRGGGTPTDIQLQESNYQTWKSKLASLFTYATSMPATGENTRVPEALKQRVIETITDIIDVDNQIIDDGIGYVETAYPEAIAAHQGTWDSMKKAAEKIKTVGQGGPTFNPNADIASMSVDDLRKVAAGGK